MVGKEKRVHPLKKVCTQKKAGNRATKMQSGTTAAHHRRIKTL
ncbi:hypothetical protein EH5_01141 [Bacillus subtilis]|nr:hypothetical protein EH5_01141 [Bacillus subtilis]